MDDHVRSQFNYALTIFNFMAFRMRHNTVMFGLDISKVPRQVNPTTLVKPPSFEWKHHNNTWLQPASTSDGNPRKACVSKIGIHTWRISGPPKCMCNLACIHSIFNHWELALINTVHMKVVVCQWKIPSLFSFSINASCSHSTPTIPINALHQCCKANRVYE